MECYNPAIMQGTEELKKLLNHFAAKTVLDTHFRDRFKGLATAEDRAEDLKRIAVSLNLDPELVDNFDLGGIEAQDAEEFVRETYFRFFEGKEPSGLERS